VGPREYFGEENLESNHSAQPFA